ncbi:MAG TPA: SOS response-associated peptidase [Terriglobales bacterium]|nr:SOS response-associated peptidase [Terriglobales bacterium]
MAVCNRFRATYSRTSIEEQFQAWDEIENTPRFNVAPTQPILTVRSESGKRKVTEMRWGLIPSWASGVTFSNFNARSESVTTTPSFRDLIKTNRCLIPADAFYEWQKIGGVKQPFAFEVGDKELFAFAGLWDEWIDPQRRLVKSCTILTTEANSLVAEMHDRMPVIVPREAYELWLDPDSSLQEVLALLKPFDSSSMHKYPVSTTLNNSQNQGPEVATKTEIKAPAQGALF